MTDNIVPGTGHSLQNNSSAYEKRAVALGNQSQTATAGTGVELDGSAVNRCAPNVALSVNVAAFGRFTMASGHSVVVHRRIDHRNDSSDSWTEYEGPTPDDLTITALNSGAAQDVDLGFGADLSGAKPEIRLAVTPDFSASGVDTVVVGAMFVFGGYDQNPAG
jgi:hypothetical protein